MTEKHAVTRLGTVGAKDLLLLGKEVFQRIWARCTRRFARC